MFKNRVHVLTCKSINELTLLRINEFKKLSGCKGTIFFRYDGKIPNFGYSPDGGKAIPLLEKKQRQKNEQNHL